MMEIVVSTNITRALMAYRVRSSDFQSFRKMAMLACQSGAWTGLFSAAKVHPAVTGFEIVHVVRRNHQDSLLELFRHD